MQHHALLYVGSHGECLSHIPLSERTGMDSEVIACESLDIAQARLLAEKASSRPIEGEMRRFIISVAHIPHEAQNALLKLFEEPPATAQFYIIVPRAEILLPTLRSRLHLLYSAALCKETLDAETAVFLGASFKERLERVALLAKEKEKTKNTGAMRALIEGIERAAGFAVVKGVLKPEDADFLSDALLCSEYAGIRGASHKMLLEHLALSIPQDMC